MENPDKVSDTRLALGKVSQLLAPATGFCLRCGMSWEFTEAHSTPYLGFRGCFPLCEKCWKELTIEQRIPYYEKLIDQWTQQGSVAVDEAQAILDAVRDGL